MRETTEESKTGRRGSILPLALIMVVILFVTGMGLLRLAFYSRLHAIVSTAGISARTAADAGITEALREMNTRFVYGMPWDNSWLPYSASGDLSASAYGNAAYNFTITGPETGAMGDLWEVVSTGKAGRATKTVGALFKLTSIFDYAVMVRDKIDLKNTGVVDGYDSNNPSAPSPYLRIGTTSTESKKILLHRNVSVEGDILVGIGGDLDVVIKEPSGGAGTGPCYNLFSTFEFEPIPIPNTGPSLGSLDGNSLSIGTLGTTTYATYDSINVRQGGRLDIEGQVVVYVTGDLRLDQGAELRVTGVPGVPATWSSLTMYLDGNLTAGQSNGINNMTYIPANFMLFGTGPPIQRWVIMNSGDFYGVYYAPNADIIIDAKGDVYGSVVGNSFELKAGGNLHYDVCLSQLDPYKNGFGIARWWEE